MQTTYGAGFITVGHTLVGLLRCLLSQAEKDAALPDRVITSEVDLEAVQPLTGGAGGETDFQSSSTSVLSEKTEKWPRARIIRIVGLVVSLNYFAATILSAVGGSIYFGAITSPKIAKLVQELRYRYPDRIRILLTTFVIDTWIPSFHLFSSKARMWWRCTP